MRLIRRATMRQPYLILIILLILAILSGGCSSQNLPPKAKTALAESITKWTGSETSFEILSAQKASDDPNDIDIPTGLTSDAGRLGACPPPGTSETWCIVISPAITDHTGNAFAHFLIQSQGRHWSAQELSATDESVFEYLGCTNWDAQ